MSKKILIVEDETSIMKGIADRFVRSGFTVLRAGDGNEGLTQAFAEHPDMILLDERMPNLNGLEMLERLRADEWGKKARGIMWSNSHDTTTIGRALEFGVMDYLVKSDWEFKSVVGRVKECIENTPA